MNNTIKKFWNNELLKGGAIFTIASIFNNVLSYFFSILAARGLGPVGFGEITALFSYMTLFSVPMLVMSLVMIQKIASKGELSEHFSLSLEEWFLAKIKKWWILIIPFVLISPYIPRITNLSAMSGYFLILLTALAVVGGFYIAMLQGLKLLIWFSAVNLLSTVLKLSGAIFVYVGIDGLLTIMIFLTLASLLTILIPHMAIRKNVIPDKKHIVSKLNKRLLEAVFNKHVMVTSLSIVAITILNNADIIFVKKFFSAYEAGIYSSWTLFAKIILYLTGPLTTVSYIFFARSTTEKHHKKVLTASFGLLLAVASVSFLFYRYSSLFVIQIFFGNKFNAVAPYLTSASIFGSVYATIVFINNYFLAKKNNFSLILTVFIPVYILLLFLIPKTLASIISLNIYFSLFIATLYLVAYTGIFPYNLTHGNKKR